MSKQKTKREQYLFHGRTLSQTRIYHGTSAKNLPLILEGGLRPRGRKGKGNWDKYPSRHDLVYMTTAYAPFFAMNCVEPGEDCALVIEVDITKLDPDLLLPDEDFIAQAIAHSGGCSIESVHSGVRKDLELWQGFAGESLERIGNVAYRGSVAPDCITRYCTFDPRQIQGFAWAACDPSISVLNYRLCGEKYRQMTAWLFGDREDWQISSQDNAQFFELMEGLQPGYEDGVRKQFSNRSSIEIVARGEANV